MKEIIKKRTYFALKGQRKFFIYSRPVLLKNSLVPINSCIIRYSVRCRLESSPEFGTEMWGNRRKHYNQRG